MGFLINTNRDKFNRLLDFVKQSLQGCDEVKLSRMLEEGILLSASGNEIFLSFVFIYNEDYNNCSGDDWSKEVKLCAANNSDEQESMVCIIKPIDIGETILYDV